MGNNIDNFILEVEARLKNDGAKLTNELKSLIKKIENEPLEININHKKLDYGIADVKAKLKELDADLNDINLDSAYKSFIKLSQILKQSAIYSKEISDAMSKLSKLNIDFRKLDDLNAHQKKKTPLSAYEKMNAGDIKKAAKNQTAIIKQM